MTRTGLILDERYRLDKRIAAGGAGQVWQATDLLLERPVAVKVLRPEYADHPETLERFRKEARHAGVLSHPNVAQVYDYAPAGPGGSPYLVMEFVDGPSLADILATDPIPPAFALDVIAQAASGLSAAHQAGLVHRDVKPGNILISAEGRVKVTDFGIAHAAGQAPVTGPGLVMGTTQYMAPERIAGIPGTPASDLYALGIVLHECLTGLPPYEGSPADVMAAHLYLPLPPLPADVPPELDDLIARMTAKDPASRISDARELAALAASLRDSLSGIDRLVPSARTVVTSGPGTAVSDQLATVVAADWARGGGLAGPAAAADRADLADAAGAGTDRADASGERAVAAGTAVAGPLSPDGFSDEWVIPARMSPPTAPPGNGPAAGGPARRRRGTLAVAAAVAASAGLIALLVSGAFGAKPTADNSPAGPSSSTGSGSPAQGKAATPSTSGTPAGSGPAGAVPGTSAATAPATASPRTTRGSGRPSPTPAARRSSSGTPGTSPANSPAGTPSSGTFGGSGPGDGTPGGSTPGNGTTGGTPSSAPPSTPPPTTPSGTPSSPATTTPPSTAPPVACVLGVCL